MGEIKRQSLNNTLLSYLGAFLGFVSIYIQPKLISSTDIGLLRLLFSFSWMAATIMPLGLGNITMRFFPRFRNESNTHNGFFAFLLLLTSIGAFIIGLLLYLNKDFFVHYYRKSPEFSDHFNEAIVFAYIVSLISVYTIYSSALLKTTFTVFLTDVFTRLAQLILVVVYSYNWITRDMLVILYIGIFLIQLILLLIFLLHIKAVSFRINWKFFYTLDKKEFLLFAMLMTAGSFASLGIKFIDQLMIGHFLSEKYIGIYATSVMICVIMEIPLTSLDRIAQPKIASAWNLQRKDEVSAIYEMSSRYMFFAGSFLFCILWSGIDFFYEFIPEEYKLGKMAFYLMSVSSLINLLTGVNTSVIALSHKYFATTVLLLLLIGVSYFANNLLIEPFGITGAAMASLISISFFNILKYVYILWKFKMQPFSLYTLYVFFTLLICTLLVAALSFFVGPLLKAIIGSACTVLAFLVLNVRMKIVPEVNKVLKRFGIIRENIV